jgi:hypothetical protein
MIRDSRVGRSVYTSVYGAEKLRSHHAIVDAEKILPSGTNDGNLGSSLDLGFRSRSKIYSPELYAGRVVPPPRLRPFAQVSFVRFPSRTLGVPAVLPAN